MNDHVEIIKSSLDGSMILQRFEPFLRTSDGLPWGEMPKPTTDVDPSSEGISHELAARVSALVNNAVECAKIKPSSAAACLHEAGRILDRKGGLSSDAWVCHSLALSFNPTHAPALNALRCLARRFGDPDQLIKVIDAQLNCKQSTVELSGLHTEKASILISKGNVSEAMESLGNAIKLDPSGLTAHLLRLSQVAKEEHYAEMLESLRALAEIWPAEKVSNAMRLTAGLMDEQRENVDEALKDLNSINSNDPLINPCLFARARMLITKKNQFEAASDMELLVSNLGNTALSGGIKRCRQALEVLCSDGGGLSVVLAEAGTAQDHWDLSIVNALKMDDQYLETEAAGDTVNYVRSDELLELFNRDKALCIDASEIENKNKDADEGSAEYSKDDRRSLFTNPRQLETDEINRVIDDLMKVDSIHEALGSDDSDRVSNALTDLRKLTLDGSDGWDIRVAEAVSLRSNFGKPQDAIQVLKDGALSLNRAPLPSLIRLHCRDSKSLATLAEAEANDAKDDAQRALLTAWSAGHLASFDQAAADAADSVALDLMPECRLALSRLRRRESNKNLLGTAFEMAALSGNMERDHLINIIESGVHYLLDGKLEKTLGLLITASDLAPDDLTLYETVKRLARGHAGVVDERLALKLLKDIPTGDGEIDEAAVLLMENDPAGATKWFLLAAEGRPLDSLIKRGLIETRFLSGRWTMESDRLLSDLKKATSAAEEAAIYLRLSEVDSKFSGNMTSSILTLMAASERIPGSRSVLARLAIYYMRQGRTEETLHIFRCLEIVLDDNEDVKALADAAWQGSACDIDSLRIAAEVNPGSLWSLAQLEARLDDPDERAKCLAAIHDLTIAPVNFDSRLGDSQEIIGDLDAALNTRTKLLEKNQKNLYELMGVERIQRKQGDNHGLVNTLIMQSDVTLDPTFSNDQKLEAAKIADLELGDSRRGAELCLEILELSPKNEQAFSLGRTLAAKLDDLELDDKILSSRIIGIKDPDAEREILLVLFDNRLSRSDLAGARDCLLSIVENFPLDVSSRLKLITLYKNDQIWDQAIKHQVEVAKLVQNQPIRVDVFFDLGVLYMDHSTQLDLAEKSFSKVLDWQRDHFGAMERIGDLYLSISSWERAAQALEYQINLAQTEAVKLQKMLDLAHVLDLRLDRTKEAELLFNNIRSAAPFDIRPIKALAGIYTKQGDAMALKVLLDQALLVYAEACVKHPTNTERYTDILNILSMKSEDQVASMAAASIRITGGVLSEEHTIHATESSWDLGPKIAETYVEDYIYPKAVPPGLRETLRAVEEPIAKLLGATAKQVSAGRRRVDKKHPLSKALANYGSTWGIRGVPIAYVGDNNEIYVAPGAPLSLLVPQGVIESKSLSTANFVAAAALTLARQGLSLVTILSRERMRLLLSGLVKISVPGAHLMGFDEAQIANEALTLKKALSPKILTHIQPFAFDCIAALEGDRLSANVLSVGNRAGFLAAGSLTGAVDALRTLAGVPTDAGLDLIPGSGGLMGFVFSKDHLELRKKLRI